MQPRSFITNGGAHPPEKHAEITAWKIVDLIRVPDTEIDPKLAPEDRAAIEVSREAYRQFKAMIEPKIAAVLVKHHADVQAGERGKLKAHGDARLTHDPVVSDHADVEAVLDEINPLFFGTAVVVHFAMSEVQARLREILNDDFGHALEIERSWHADASQSPVAQAYRHARMHHGAHQVHAHAKAASAA